MSIWIKFLFVLCLFSSCILAFHLNSPVNLSKYGLQRVSSSLGFKTQPVSLSSPFRPFLHSAHSIHPSFHKKSGFPLLKLFGSSNSQSASDHPRDGKMIVSPDGAAPMLSTQAESATIPKPTPRRKNTSFYESLAFYLMALPAMAVYIVFSIQIYNFWSRFWDFFLGIRCWYARRVYSHSVFKLRSSDAYSFCICAMRQVFRGARSKGGAGGGRTR